MNLDFLLQKIASSRQINELLDCIESIEEKDLFLNGLKGSGLPLVFAALFKNENFAKNYNHVVVCEDNETAAYLHNDLENIFNPADLFYFPSSFKHKKNYSLINSSNAMLRSEALTRIANGGNKKIIVTYPEAIFEKVVIQKVLKENVIDIKLNDTLDIEALLQKFVALGFTHEDFVYEPGQFALRGGILDIYTFGNEKPYRIELFGNDVETIRIFDPTTQLSERNLLHVQIIPNVSTKFKQTERISITEFMPKNTLFWLCSHEFIIEKLDIELLNVKHFIENHNTQNNTDNIDEDEYISTNLDLFITPNLFSQELNKFKKIYFFQKPKSDFHEIKFKQESQPSFNRNFELLIKNLKEFEAKNYTSFIFAENARQLERLNSIFTDLKSEIPFVAVAKDIHSGLIDHELKVVCYTDHQIFQRYHKYKVKQAFSKNKILNLKTLKELQPGDYIVHIDHGVGIFSGLEKVMVNGKMQESVRIRYKDNDLLYVNISSLHKISKYTGKEGTIPKVNKLGSDVWAKLKAKTTKQVKDIATDLIKLYAERKSHKGFAHSPDNYLQTELEASFIYEDTPDQNKATQDVKRDMEKDTPMDRLVCGDVGFGKTEVAIRAAFKTVCDGKQAAVLVPTTILAYQHYKSFKERLKEFPVTVNYINRFKSAKAKKETLKELAEGKIDILVGTHALLSKDVKFKDLGLMIIDEEQKFGVSAKEKLKQLRTTVDSLTLTATPIPRTLQFSLMGARDLSIINTPPPNRQPIQTEVKVFNDNDIRDAIYFEISRGGQVFFVHNRVKDLEQITTIVKTLCPDVSVAQAHGQMDGAKLEDTILDFIDRKYDVLVCTNIVESGVDIPNVNTIIINNAHQFGLSDLHQLRGRVGRSNKKAFCYLFAPPISVLPGDSRKRLQTIEQYSDLGSGFQIAMRDLDIRGAGNLLGAEQSGFINEIGFEMYHKILNEAIRDLKREKFRDLFKEEIAQQDDFVSDCTIDTDFDIYIPDSYVENSTERLSLYYRLDNCENEEDLKSFEHELNDRFGKIPEKVNELFTTVRCRRLAIELGFEKMVIKDNILKCFFVPNPDSPYFQSETFNQILKFIQHGTNKATLKQVGKNGILVVSKIDSMESLYKFLLAIKNFK